MEENLPPGFRFHPTDEELITYYLTNKVSDFNFTTIAMADVDLNKCEPWDLPAKASMGEKEWYFFSMRDRKYPTGLRTNRATEAGYWKTTGKDKEIFRGGILVGMKKTLVFYKGRAPKGEKTNWVMHEYRQETRSPYKPIKEEWVVCRVFHKNSITKKPQQPQSSHLSIDSPCDTNTMANEFGDVELPNLNSSSAISNIALQNHHNYVMNNLNMNWPVATEAANTLPPLTSWPPSLMGSNLSMNALLLRALQLRSFNQPRAVATNEYPFMPQGNSNVPQIGSDHFITPNFSSASSSSRVLDSVNDQVQNQEQPFNLDSIW